MLKITKGTVTLEVTKGSYENLFKDMGYTIVEPKKIEKPKTVDLSDVRKSQSKPTNKK